MAAGGLLRISVERSGDAAVLRLDGELDVATAPDVDAALRSQLDRSDPARRVVVDAERLRFADVAGLGPLIRTARHLPAGRVQLRNASRPVARLVRLLDLGETLGLDT